ncbi:MAG: M64 family metallopeptidase, partial [Bacteroidota bacterium]
MRNKFWLFALLLQGFLFEQASAQVVLGVDTLVNNGNKNNRINLVFLGDGYTAAQQSQFIADVNTIVNKLFITPPFNRYTNFFNVYAVHVASVESGADHPHTAADCSSANPQVPNATVNTMLGATFDYGGIHRLLYCTNTTNINSILQSYAPFFDKALIVVNSPYYGGSGGTYPTCSVEANSAEIMIHELGHSFAALGDEYGGTSCGGTEKPNCTQETNPTLIKWKNWFPTGVTIPTPPNTNCSSIGLYLGANYCNTNWYRPKCNCKMNQLNNPFCEVCSQELIYSINNTINLIDTYSPSTSSLTLTNGQSQTFSVTALTPSPNSLFITWKMDNAIAGINITSYTVSGTSLSTGTHTLILSVTDSTALSKKQMPIYNTVWTITKSGTTVTLAPFNPVCVNASEFALTGGSPNGGTYSGPGVVNGNFSAAIAGVGIHTITYTYSGSSATQPLTVNPLPNVSVIGASSICKGNNTVLTASGASTYSWSPSASLNSSTGTSVTASPTVTTTYSITGSNNGCTATATKILTVNVKPIIAATSTPTTCLSSTDGMVDATITPAGQTLFYSWSNGTTTQDLQNISAGNYAVTVSNSIGCYALKSVTVTAPSCSGISGITFSNVNSSSATINWNQNTCAASVKLRRKATTETNWKYAEVTGTSFSKTYSNLQAGKTYEVQVMSYCNSARTDSSGYSPSYYFTTASSCVMPSGLIAMNVTTTSATLKWNAGNAYNYKLRYRISGGTWHVATVAGGATQFTLNNLIPNTAYQWVLKSVCDSVGSDFSSFTANQNFTTLSGAKLEENNSISSSWTVYPNPTTDKIIISN